MQTIGTANEALAQLTNVAFAPAGVADASPVDAPPERRVRPHDARTEINELMDELHDLVSRSESSGATPSSWRCRPRRSSRS